MCAPTLISAVRDDLSRRGFLGLVGASAAIVAGSPGRASAQPRPVRLPGGFRETYDLTHTLSSHTPVFPSFQSFQAIERFTIERDGFGCYELRLNEHTGTHMDAPIHFVAGEDTIERVPADRLIAPLAVVSIGARADRDPDTLLNVDDIRAWEARYGRLPAGALVAMDSGWDARIDDAGRFLNPDADGTLHSPGFGGEAARFLVEERDIVGVAVDTISLDAGNAQPAVAHLTLLGAGKYGLELVANLGLVPPSGATAIVGAPKHLGGTGGPVRLLAVA